MDACELTILMPCLNEAETIAQCIQKAQYFLTQAQVRGEILIADNGSTDGSQAIASQLGARVIPVAKRGYGAALKEGMHAAHGTYIIMGDADDSYDFAHLLPFLQQLRAGYELVMGNRFRGGIQQGAMPWLNRYIGNPILSRLGRLFFKSPIGDFHCGLRGFNRQAFLKLDLQGDGMEFASEMVVKATLKQFKITEVPTALHPDGRSRRPHLRPWRDGWRHLRLLLLFSPRWLFLYPAIVLLIFGSSMMLLLMQGPLTIGQIQFDIHSLLFSALFMIVGLQILCFAFFAQIIASIHLRLAQPNHYLIRFLQYFTLERGLIIGLLLIISGCSGSIYLFWYWQQHAYGSLMPAHMMRILIPAITAVIIGVQLMFASFFMSLLEWHYEKDWQLLRSPA